MDNFLERMNVSLFDLVNMNSHLRNDPKMFAALIALSSNVLKTNIKPAIECNKLVQANKLGPIIFCSPELGRWSTVGGLGVMVDELSVGLANLG
jgi:starch synthase